ncbi:zinc ribbon domain-containing protein [Shewanella maritima]|uniref:zinc ribbon domain-containing protein n=1 Tax=Shewanella maritima TaxID=2520507 RepID=UPI0037356E52
MALIDCPSCQKRISSQAKQCSHCKANLDGNSESLVKISHIQKSNSLMTHSIVFLTLLIAGAAMWIWKGEVAQGWQAIMAIVSFSVGVIGYMITRIRIVIHKRKSV